MAKQPDLSEFEALTENSELRRILSDTQARLRQATAKVADVIHAVREGARDAALVLGNPPPVKAPSTDTRKRKAEAALLHTSDWQLGKVTETYNSGVAVRRVDQLGKVVSQLVEIERADRPVRECHLLLGGDLVEGVSIFPRQAFEIDSSLFKQVFTCASALEGLLRQLLSTFEHVNVWEEYGNHGRIGKKDELPGQDSVDLLLYRLVRERFKPYEDERRLVWNPFEETPGKFYSIVKIGNYSALLIHGDEIKQFGGNLPAFGIMRKANAWASGAIPEPFVDVYLGHFHQPMALPLASGRGRVFVNAALESSNAMAQEFMAALGTPAQRLNFVEPVRGRVTSERLVYLDDVI